jgi:hypothetical protein
MEADIHRLNVITLQELSKVSIYVRDGEPLGNSLSLSFIDVGYGDHLGALYRLIPVQMDLANLPHPNDTDTYGIVLFAIGHHSLLMLWCARPEPA